ncbi:hypothetical protein ZWY2020_035986 [Hordeum vulgare]|nr:hypothetical protein ZWY2020_035986 [Hordeum vulgare]
MVTTPRLDLKTCTTAASRIRHLLLTTAASPPPPNHLRLPVRRLPTTFDSDPPPPLHKEPTPQERSRPQLLSPRRAPPSFIAISKTRGMGAGRKLKTHRRNQRWADKAYNKSHLGNEWKKPFMVISRQGHCFEKIGIEAKQPNSAIRKCARVQLDEVLIAGFGRKGHAVGDIPGVRFKVVKVSGVLLALFKEKKEKPRS